MLALHCLRGSYPLLPLFHLAGARTTREIAAEMYALKQRRGDFASLDNAATEEERAAAAYDAAALC